jgi:hypothetical protein
LILLPIPSRSASCLQSVSNLSVVVSALKPDISIKSWKIKNLLSTCQWSYLIIWYYIYDTSLFMFAICIESKRGGFRTVNTKTWYFRKFLIDFKFGLDMSIIRIEYLILPIPSRSASCLQSVSNLSMEVSAPSTLKPNMSRKYQKGKNWVLLY